MLPLPPEGSARALDRTAFSVASLSDADDTDRRYWWTRTPEERLQALQQLRHLNYGADASARLQRVLEVAPRERR